MAKLESPAATPEYSDDVLNEIEGRAVKFLSAVGRTPLIRAQLGTVGYDEDEHRRGWALLHKAAQFEPAANEAPVDPTIAAAVRELNDLDESLVTRVKAAATRLFPKHVDALLKNVEPKDGPEAVQVVATLLANFDAVEGQADGAVVIKGLAKRGLDAKERNRLKALVETAQKLTTVKPPVRDDQRRQSLSELKAWFDDWAETSRTVVKRRDLQIRMGLAERKASKPETPPA